ncbi:MAG: DUF1461 domain-containing protein [Clostridiales bacterium]|nr:DUF1461 domain-containing protein [Clostridiales bacterium]
MDPYAVQNRMVSRRKTSLLGALLSLALGLCLTVLSLGYAAGVHVTDIGHFREATDAALVQTGMLSEEDAERFAQETVGYLTGRRAAWLSAVTVNGQAVPVPDTFTEHMAAVQSWVLKFRYMLPLMIADVVILVFLTLLGAAAMRSRTFSPRGYLLGAVIPILAGGAVFLWALIDFTSFWETLHRIVIPGGIFAADEPVMQLFPIAMFRNYLGPIALTFLYLMAGILLLPAILLMVDRRVRRRRLERHTPYEPAEYR